MKSPLKIVELAPAKITQLKLAAKKALLLKNLRNLRTYFLNCESMA
jgi:hypothetical protein